MLYKLFWSGSCENGFFIVVYRMMDDRNKGYYVKNAFVGDTICSGICFILII